MQERLLLTKFAESTEREQRGRPVSSMPPVLLEQATRRLRILSLSFALLFAFAWIVPHWLGGSLFEELTSLNDLLPGALVLVSSLVVFGMSRGGRVPPGLLVNVGLVYQVVVSFGLAFLQYWGVFQGVDATDVDFDRVGLTTVAVWMLLFTVVVPARPRNSLLALLFSALAVPTTFALSASVGDAPVLAPFQFFFTLVFPYLIVAISAFFAAAIMYRMGTELRRAQELGSYRLEERLGSGGMGEVWRARHAMLARPAAVKLIRPNVLAGDSKVIGTAAERFEREAQAIARLQSQHTVALYDYGVSKDGTLFYVMELLDGVDLGTLIEHYGPLPPERVVHILIQACESLEEAHTRGLVHRDIKPTNLYLCRHALEYDFLKVLDFGLVKRHPEIDDKQGESFAEMGIVAGTPAFIAPELGLGREAIDGRADIYSLGCVAYWLLTGRLVFEENTPMAMIVAHVNNLPDLPSRHTDIPVPVPLERLIMECLAKDRADRPGGATDLARRLAEIELSEPWTRERATQWWQTHAPAGPLSPPH